MTGETQKYMKEVEKLKRSYQSPIARRFAYLKENKGWIILYILMAAFFEFMSDVGIIRLLLGTLVIWALVVLIARAVMDKGYTEDPDDDYFLIYHIIAPQTGYSLNDNDNDV